MTLALAHGFFALVVSAIFVNAFWPWGLTGKRRKFKFKTRHKDWE